MFGNARRRGGARQKMRAAYRSFGERRARCRSGTEHPGTYRHIAFCVSSGRHVRKRTSARRGASENARGISLFRGAAGALSQRHGAFGSASSSCPPRVAADGKKKAMRKPGEESHRQAMKGIYDARRKAVRSVICSAAVKSVLSARALSDSGRRICSASAPFPEAVGSASER